MGGYTPAFASIYSGTLYGRWPTAAVWASLLPLIDSRGHIELSYEAIAGMTGWPLKLLRKGIENLMQPDPGSSSKLEEGRRLVLIDPERPWGWRAVNVQKYRDKASGADQVSDGRNAEKVRKYKERHRRTPEDTGGTEQTPTHTQTQTQTQTEEKKGRGERASAPATRLPEDFSLTPERRAIAVGEHIDAEREFAKFTDHWRSQPGAKGRKLDWDATWRNWCRSDIAARAAKARPEQPTLTWRPPAEDGDAPH